jgi:hypothetical protein
MRVRQTEFIRGALSQNKARTKRVWTVKESQEQLAIAYDAYVQGLTIRDTRKAMEAKGYVVSVTRATKLRDKAMSLLEAECEASRAGTKARQLRRLYAHLANARGAKQYAAIARFEQLIARLEGNEAPIQIAVEQRQAIVLAEMSARATTEEVDEALRWLVDNTPGLVLPAGVSH